MTEFETQLLRELKRIKWILLFIFYALAFTAGFLAGRL